jgi:2'-5' RNA ligase
MTRSETAMAYVAADWQRYQALDNLVNHWQRPGWTPGRRSYHWMIAFESAPKLHTLAARCRAALQDDPMLDLVPLNRLHITLERAGFTDEISEPEARAIAEAGQARCATIPAPTLVIGPLAGSAGAVRFSAGPHEALHTILTAVRAAIADVLRGAPALPGNVHQFIPHVSIAYSNTVRPAQPLVARVAGLRALGKATVHVTTVQLVELRREGRQYAWDKLGEATLQASS